MDPAVTAVLPESEPMATDEPVIGPANPPVMSSLDDGLRWELLEQDVAAVPERTCSRRDRSRVLCGRRAFCGGSFAGGTGGFYPPPLSSPQTYGPGARAPGRGRSD